MIRAVCSRASLHQVTAPLKIVFDAEQFHNATPTTVPLLVVLFGMTGLRREKSRRRVEIGDGFPERRA